MLKIFVSIVIIFIITIGVLTIDFFNTPDIEVQVEESIKEPEVAVIEEIGEAEVPILIYHHIRQLKEKDATSSQQFIVSPENFENQIKYLKDNNFNSISLNNLVDYFDGNFVLPEKSVIITFDDGVTSQYHNAFPVLQKYGMTATFFIFPNSISNSVNYMTWEQLAEMDQAGMEIGSHGWYHLYWDRISEDELEREVVKSKNKLEEELGHEISILAYPFGSYNEEVQQTVEYAGYKAARDIINGVVHTKEGLFNLRGYFVTNSFSRFINIVTK